MSTISESKEQSDLEVQAQKISFVLEQLLLLARTETSNWRASVDTLTSCEGAIDQLERTLAKRSLSCEFCEGLRNELHTIQTLIERLPPSSGTDFCGHRGMRSPRHRGSHHPTGEQDSKYKSNTVESIEHECEGSSGIRTPTTSVRHAVLARSETQRPSTHRSPRSKKNMSPATSPRVIRVPPLTELMDHAACSGPQSKSPFRLSQASHRAHCPACLARRCRRAQPAACSPEPERSASAGMKSPRKSNRSRSVFARDTTMTSYHVTKMRVGTSRAEELIRSVGVNSNCVNIAQVEIEIQTLEKRQHPRLIRYFCLERQESETPHICPHSFDAGSSLTSAPQVQYRLLKEISPRGSMTLTKFLQKRRADGVPLSNMELCWFVYDIAQAVAHLHRLDIVHGALLPSCALVTHEKLQGQHVLRCVVDWYGSMTGQLEPNDKFRSPESLNATEEQRSQEEDMWCLGMLSVYIFTRGTFRDPPTAKERSEGRNTSVTTNSTSPVSPGLPNRPACCPPQIWDDAISLCFEPKDLRIRALDFVQAFQYYVRPPWEA